MNSAALRLVMAVAYPLLAHWATHGGGDLAAALALLDLAVLVLADALLQRRAWALTLLVAIGAALWWLIGTPALQVLLLAPPMVFTGLLAWLFARSLRSPRGALITRIVIAMEQCPAEALPADLRRYSRRLTAAWAWLLAGLTVANGVLALIAVPDGLLARLGQAPPIAVTQAQWSLFANLLNYGIVGGFFLGEYALRRRWFPPRSYRNFFDFLRRMAGLGPRFWRELFET